VIDVIPGSSIDQPRGAGNRQLAAASRLVYRNTT
jgi:hypothetical protein